MKNTKNAEKMTSLRNIGYRSLVPTIQPQPDFSQTCGFWKDFDNVDFMNFQNILMTRCKDTCKKLQKYPQNEFSLICDPQGFFQNWDLSLLYPYGALTSCKKLANINGWYLRYLNTDHRPTNRRTTDRLTRVIT